MRTIFLISMAVVVSFAGFAESAAYKKVTIGVGNIEYRAKDSDSTNRFRAISRSGPGAIREDSRAFVSMITTALVKTRKFTVIERDRMGEILQEQDMATSGLTRGGYRKKKLSMAGVQYILTGAITEFGVNKNKLAVRGFSIGSSTTSMSVDVRIVHVGTGEISLADSVRSQISSKGNFRARGFGKTSSSGDGSSLGRIMRITARKVTNLVVNTIFPVKVVKIMKNGDVALNYGDGTFSVGDTADLILAGEKLVDPTTGEILGSEEELSAILKITKTHPRFSMGSVVWRKEKETKISRGMIVRIRQRTKLPEDGFGVKGAFGELPDKITNTLGNILSGGTE